MGPVLSRTLSPSKGIVEGTCPESHPEPVEGHSRRNFSVSAGDIHSPSGLSQIVLDAAHYHFPTNNAIIALWRCAPKGDIEILCREFVARSPR